MQILVDILIEDAIVVKRTNEKTHLCARRWHKVIWRKRRGQIKLLVNNPPIPNPDIQRSFIPIQTTVGGTQLGELNRNLPDRAN